MGPIDTALDALGSYLASLYDLLPNYGVAIILLTLTFRLLLLPLGIKQIRSQHQMQAIQPEVRKVQQKYKGNRQKMNEEMMKLYQEQGVNPLSGCWPLLVQLPVLFALFAILRPPTPGQDASASHLPAGSSLQVAIHTEDTYFLGMNLLCTAVQSGAQVPLEVPGDGTVVGTRDCGGGLVSRLPYVLLAGAMVGTTYYQQRQMQRAAPPGSQNPQQQAILRVMPLIFGVWGFFFPAGLVVYWTTSNLWQIGQQHWLIKARLEAEAGGASSSSAPKGKPSGGSGTGRGKASGRKGQGGSGGNEAGSRKKRRKR